MPATKGDLYLYIQRDEDADTVTFHFPFVTSIDDSINASLTTKPTIVYGARNNFCMDLGTTRRFTFSVTRVSPVDYDNNSGNSDDWSNGEFWNRFRDAVDYWQNFGCRNGERTGGFTMSFVSGDTELYPSLSGNVFLNGSINPTFKVGSMTLSIPLVVASHTGIGGSAVETVTITLHTVDDEGTSYTETRSAPKNFRSEAPEYPTAWLNLRQGMSIVGWDTSPSADTVVYRAGDEMTWSEDTDLYAVWLRPIAIHVWDVRGKEDAFPIPQNAASCTLICVGGGGAGGIGAHKTIDDDYYNTFTIPGGAGGAGQLATWSITVYPGDDEILTCTLGQGGHYSGWSSVDAEDTVVYYNGREVARASGGDRGGSASTSGAVGVAGDGGERFTAGGMCVIGATTVSDLTEEGMHGTDGSTQNGLGIAGTGAPQGTVDGTTVFHYLRGPGGGGGAAPLMASYTDTEGNRYPSSGQYVSEGGDGFTRDHSAANDGKLGGGGGGGVRTQMEDGTNMMFTGGNGGDGIVIALFYPDVV